MKLSTDNQHLFTYWCSARNGRAVPHISSSQLIAHEWIGKNICLQFMAADEKIRFVWAGQSVQDLLGYDLTGQEVVAVYAQSEHAVLEDMQRWKFSNPAIIQAHSNVHLANGEMIQVEFIHLPFINEPTGDVIYAIGCVEWSQADEPSKLADAMQSRALLSRCIFDIKNLKPVVTDFTYPHPNEAEEQKTARA